MSLIYFILCASGMTSIIVHGTIFDKIRPNWKLFKCCQCCGFWVGMLLWIISPYTTLFNFDRSLVTMFLLGCLSSATSYVIDVIFDDEGIKIK